MLVNLTQKQIEEIIEALEKDTEQVKSKFSTLCYLKIVKREEIDFQPAPELDDIPF
jgi:hypothetical protein